MFYDYDDTMEEIHQCPVCDHEQDEAECFLGRLGYLTHFRCRYCGMQWSES
jgi:transcription elongation factor Elf1